jgi:hypothetical protein
MFLVSQDFGETAKRVFYGRNRFRAHMEEWQPSLANDDDYEGRRPAADISIRPGLEDFPKGSIGFLTYLCLQFDWSDLETLQPSQPGWKHWLDTIALLSREANLAVLTLEIKLAQKWYPEPRDRRPDPDPVYKNRMRDTYDRFIQQVVGLKGLKNCFVHLSWSTSCTERHIGAWNGRLEAEQRLERMIMGDKYDAWECGKVGCHNPDSFDY